MRDRSESARHCGETPRRGQRRRLRAPLAGVLLAAAASATALAAPLGLTTQPLGAAAAAVLPCDTDGFTYAFSTTGGNVSAVTVGDMADPGCEGGVLKVTLVGSSGAALAAAGPETIASDGDTSPNSVLLVTDSQPPAGAVAAIRAVVDGP